MGMQGLVKKCRVGSVKILSFQFSVFRSEEEELERFYRQGAKGAKGRSAGGGEEVPSEQ